MKRALIVVGLLSVAGCSSKPNTTSASGQQDGQAIGGVMEQAGVMSQADYVRLRQIRDSIRQSRQISDGDLDWSLSLLKSSSQPTARSRIANMFVLLQNTPQSQKDKIKGAVTPLLSSQDELDRKTAELVLKSLS